MKRYEVVQRIEKVGVVAVVRAENTEKAKNIALACMKGGIDSIEITFTVPRAQNVIEDLSTEFGKELLVGAGTVLDSETARIAILAGANYIVSPAFDLETAKLCNRYQIPYMPGCMTIKEMIIAMEAGADVLKIFPGSVFGPDYIKAVKGPLPQALMMPTGGVSIDNVDKWIKNGCIAVGIGGNLTQGSSEEITRAAKEFVEKIKLARQ
ncbi:bifunctional 2-keto-4-hydroxyglutarate aldolase/2-keto-3-deoxy-6-phosphogluconate aldolase [Serpentinicella alkaliphila]|uniref:2-dehydro-3-deoxyphosphogluconate aldolase/(4S)-4-hydroxy-2-oxoglutarate aldolase n=1 Tax=Serpentinicella alkaliphila TaxID=1734049 RepID=A0A4R2TXS6_9FIRM|nr:bifunctional 2-keto-4-hydroxyglutarate aldolase/2-keto-3-deoxy-6-phosphogluconate aldolase [Serpentinicella alkaliphila]QUH26820.1 bifunctional 2-keto-4-hydroxyglutarate aldolase/2-keto-3-deoxy-6-phosphogluconate aldolase [Serpentinicella alkaliphila]TCQ08046.1 2-dehydro-3-deoxyphosphogluconate aldolase/(4S)-4-hydroxy-2-oxoglutarate aldolase [Serpentinicella alkaliphila]